MAYSTLIAGTACGAAFVAATHTVLLLQRRINTWNRDAHVSKNAGSDGNILALLLSKGIPQLQQISQWFLQQPSIAHWIDELLTALKQKGLQSQPNALMSLILAAGIVLLIGGSLLSGSLVAGATLAGIFVLGCQFFITNTKNEASEKLQNSLPDALNVLQQCFKVGYSLPQALHAVSEEIDGPLGEACKQSAEIFSAGGTLEVALQPLKNINTDSELTFIVLALQIQHRSGAGLEKILDTAKQTVDDEITLRRSLRTQTAQARLSAQIVTALPFVLLALFSLFTEGFLDPFFSSLQGAIMLVVALLMEVIGVALVRHMLAVGEQS